MSKMYIHERSGEIGAGAKVEIPDDAISVTIVPGYSINGQPTEKRYVEWLEPVR